MSDREFYAEKNKRKAMKKSEQKTIEVEVIEEEKKEPIDHFVD